MEVAQVLHMNGGDGETSYATNSQLQQKAINKAKHVREEAMVSLYCSSLPASLVRADLGCSSGPNTLFVVSELIKMVDNTRRSLGRPPPEYQVFLNDLPGNDFNTIFRSLSSFQEKLRDQTGPCFFTGVPGSFYNRLFPAKSLHFVHSSYSLQWLSKVPEGLENNKRNIYMACTSPPEVLQAYYKQFQRDFSMFLKCRSEELVEGGLMVLTFLGRRSPDPSSKECCYIWELLAVALSDMVSEGIIEEEKLDSFNIPQYTPSPEEVKSEVLREGSFAVNRLEVTEVHWNAYDSSFSPSHGFNNAGYNVANCMRAVAEPLLVSHFGEVILDGVFQRYQMILADRMAKENTEFVNVTISVTKN